MKKALVPRILLSLLVLPAAAAAGDAPIGKLELSGDLRFRLERDYETSGRENRDRFRARLRIAANSHQGPVHLGARLVTGDPQDQASANQTLGGDFSKKELHLDLVFLEYTRGRARGWLGKHVFPFWKQNEMFWDDDVTPEGATLDLRWGDDDDGASAQLTGGYYIIDDQRNFSEPVLAAAQGTLGVPLGNGRVTVAGGLFAFRNANGDRFEYNPLMNLDWRILVVSSQWKGSLGTLPVRVGADFMANLEKVDESRYENETEGWVLQLILGSRKGPGRVEGGLHIVRIEKYAIVPHFAQGDWWRFGDGHSEGSDFGGFALHTAIRITDTMHLTARHYLAQGIVSGKDSMRLRLDLTTRF